MSNLPLDERSLLLKKLLKYLIKKKKGVMIKETGKISILH